MRERCRSSVICELLGLPPADRPKFIAWANTVARLAGVTDFLRMLGGLWPMKRYLEERLRLARAHGGEGLIAELVRVEAEGGRISVERDGVDGLSAAGRGLGDHDASDQRIGLRAAQESRPARLARGRLEPRQSGGRGVSALRVSGAVLEAALRATRHRARRRALEEGRQDHGHGGGSQHGPGGDRAARNDSIFSGDPTGTSPSGPESISALAISWRASKAYVPCRRCSHAGRDCGSRSSPRRSAGANGRASGRSKSCRSWQVHNRYLASGDESQPSIRISGCLSRRQTAPACDVLHIHVLRAMIPRSEAERLRT